MRFINYPEISEINKMHSEPVTTSTAWTTGSFVREVTQDINDLLENAMHLESERKFEEVCNCYKKAINLLAELDLRAQNLQEQPND